MGVEAEVIIRMAAVQCKIQTDLGNTTCKNIEQLKMIYSVVFPVRYSEQFFKDVVTNADSGLIKLAYHNAVMVGGICCRLEEADQKVYIMTIGILAPYQRCGIGSKLLAEVLSNVEKDFPKVKEVYLHVQEGRDDAVAFYQKHGFVQGEALQNYYKNADPPHATVLRKTMQ